MLKTYLAVFSCLMSLYGFAAAPTVSSFTPTSAATGTTVTISGSNFTNATVVSFGGTPASSFTVVSSTQITAVVDGGSSGNVSVTTSEGTGSKSGFNYLPLSGIMTDFNGFWSSTTASPNSVVPNDSHNLLAFTYNGTTYSTGVNNGILSTNGINYTAGNFKALPVAGITGTSASSTATYLALARKVDGSLNVANPSTVSGYSLKSVMIDGQNGLNLGTGFTNLPTTAILTFRIFNIDSSRIADAEPDIILTQIAQPVSGNDIFSFVDSSGKVVGRTVTQDMTLLQRFGTYALDLFNLTPNTPYNSAKLYNANAANTTREIRLVGFKLSDFGITADSISKVKALKITPSGNSDYAFIAYNANALNLPPNISVDDSTTNAIICSGGTANLAVIGTAAAGGSLSYSWEQSVDGGNTWSAVTNGSTVTGATTNILSVTNPADGSRYRSTVMEAGNGNTSISPVFTVGVITQAAPTSVTVSGTASTCLNTPVQLSSSVTGGTNLYYQWQSNASGSYTNISGANARYYTPAVNSTGAVSYRLLISSGSGCPAITSATPATITVTGISSVTPSSVCSGGGMNLTAAATSGTIDWYATDTSGSSLYTGTTFTTPFLSATTTYYVASSGCSNALRVPVVATVYPNSAGGSISGSTTVNPGINSTTLTLSGYTGSVLKWQSSTDSFNTVITDLANTTAAYTATNLAATTQYRSIVQSGTCASVSSSIATITVQGGTLPVTFRSVKATEKDHALLVQWSVENQLGIQRYEVEKSSTGRSFLAAHSVASKEGRAGGVSYSWLDQQVETGANFYRIRSVDQNGQFTYSTVVKVSVAGKLSGISFYPNPVTGNTISLQFNNMAAGNYNVVMLNSSGQVAGKMSLKHTGGNAAQTLRLPGGVTKGMYKFVIVGPGNSSNHLSAVIL
ncbi:MAG: IPT/TIG domain-containing protein [Williamsia sp.]|nr:IPT/TIG domain-containing protein [Williamsia sp.]